MKIIYKNLKEGRIKIRAESGEDLWYLKSIIAAGDLIAGRSYRRVRDEEKIRADKGVRIPITLDIRAENVEFHSYAARLRITGKIERGPEDVISLGSHHTIELQPADTIEITKTKWKKWELERLKEAEKAAKTPLVLVVSVEDREAEFAIVRRYGIDFVARVTSSMPGKELEKEREESIKKFYSAVAGKLDEILKREKVEGVVVCGPGFVKDGLLSFLKDKRNKAAEMCRIESAGSGGRSGVYEALKRGAVERIAKESRVSMETMLVEKVFEEIGKSSMLAAYGIEEVEKALGYGAIEKLLVADAFLRKNGIDKIIEKTKKIKGEVLVISTEHEAGERLQAIGGIAALLRFPLG